MTYIIVNNNLITKLKNIKEFQLDLGLSLTSPQERLKENIKQHQFLPGDELIQQHYTNFNEIINKIGNIGSLYIYSQYHIDYTTIKVINDTNLKEYNINTNNNIYSELNKILGNFINTNTEEINKSQPQNNKSIITTKTNIDEVDPTVNRPVITAEEIVENNKSIQKQYDKIKHKPLSQMSITERIIYARGRQ